MLMYLPDRDSHIFTRIVFSQATLPAQQHSLSTGRCFSRFYNIALDIAAP